MEKKNPGGRPPNYTAQQLSQAVAVLEAKFPDERPSATAVKDQLCLLFNVSKGTNAQSLEGELQRFYTERDERRERDMIEALPTSMQSDSADVGKAVEKQILAAFGRGFAELKKKANREVCELQQDKTQLHRRIEGMELEIAEKDAEIERLKADLGNAENQIVLKQHELDQAVARIRDLETADESGQRILNELSKLLDGRGLSYAPKFGH
ncbi:MAG TPA: hypothetical protein DEO85_03170 [Maritimibacter sp.]|nr:hypothetical protein [Maritimibacter sp.]